MYYYGIVFLSCTMAPLRQKCAEMRQLSSGAFFLCWSVSFLWATWCLVPSLCYCLLWAICWKYYRKGLSRSAIKFTLNWCLSTRGKEDAYHSHASLNVLCIRSPSLLQHSTLATDLFFFLSPFTSRATFWRNGRQKVNATLRMKKGTMGQVHDHSSEVIGKGHQHCCHLSCLQNNAFTTRACDSCHGWKETDVNWVPSDQYKLTATAKDSEGRWAVNRNSSALYCTNCHSLSAPFDGFILVEKQLEQTTCNCWQLHCCAKYSSITTHN